MFSDKIALMLPCCQKLLPWISVTGHRHSGSRFGGAKPPHTCALPPGGGLGGLAPQETPLPVPCLFGGAKPPHTCALPPCLALGGRSPPHTCALPPIFFRPNFFVRIFSSEFFRPNFFVRIFSSRAAWEKKRILLLMNLISPKPH